MALGAAAIELAFWYGSVAGFLWLYVHIYGGPHDSIGAHLALFSVLLSGLLSLRAFAGSLPIRSRWVKSLELFLFLPFALTMLVYDALVLTGLQSWGKVITWRLIVTYASQAPDLAQSLGINQAMLIAIGLLTIAVSILICRVLWHRLSWPATLLAALPAKVAMLAPTAMLAIMGLRIYEFTQDIGLPMGEPLRLTFFPLPAVRAMQSNELEGTAELRVAEDQVRQHYVPSTRHKKRNVVLIVCDALRPDHMGVYGYARDTTPFLSELLRGGHLGKVDRMTAVCTESSCGLLGIARSKYVHQMSSNDFTLHEVLSRNGYKIHLILGGDHTNFYGLKDAYGKVDSYFDGSMARPYYMNDDELVLDHVSRIARWDGVPVMFQFHMMSAHGLGKRHPADMAFEPSSNYVRKVPGRSGPNDEATNYYDNGVRGLDRTLRALFTILREKGYLDDTLIIVTADHGEMLGEHGEFTHSKGVFESALRVPFIYIGAGRAPLPKLRHDTIASQTDIAPTVLYDLDMQRPSTWAGQALQTPGPRDFIYFQQGAQAGLLDLRQTDRQYKYWSDLRSNNEYVFDVTNGREVQISPESMPVDLRADWRKRVLPVIARLSY